MTADGSSTRLTAPAPASYAASRVEPVAAEGLAVVPSEDKTVISKRRGSAPPSPFRSSTLLLGGALAGKRLEHYELNEFVGGGGMGAVFRATDTRLGRTVAVKVLSRDHTDEETIRRFRNEAQNAARLDHPNIARVHYVGEDQGWNFIVFEFIEGTNLRDQIEAHGPLGLEQALNYTLQVAEALAHSSSRDVVHRDIKPSNVLVMAEGQVKLVDMGLARFHQTESPADELTASGVTLGTFDYISPEQASDPRAADVRSDIYSLGCTLFYMLTGQPPFADGTALQKLLRHNSENPPDVRIYRPEMSPQVVALLGKMLAKRPAQRHQSAAELINAIVALGYELNLPSVAQHAQVAIPAPLLSGRGWLKLWQSLAAVALLAVTIVAISALSPSQAGNSASLPPAQFLKPATATAPTATGVLTQDGPTANAKAQLVPAATETNKIQAATPAPLGDPNHTSAPSIDRRADDSPNASAVTPGNVVDATEKIEASAQDSLPPGAAATVAPPLRPKRIVVGPGAHSNEPESEFVATLAEACARAAELGVADVELRFSGERVEAPVEIVSQRLTIRAAAGFRPVLVFRPHDVIERQMIRMAGTSSAHLSWQGVELRLEIPADPPTDGWSLLAINTAQSLDLTDCVLTIEDGEAASFHDQVSMIAVQRRRPVDVMMMPDPQLAMGQQATIRLERSIARGEAAFVSLTDETPLTIAWNQGLLVTSRHFLESAGSAISPKYYDQIVLDLDNVTAYCREGLYYMRRGPGKAYQFRVYAYADHCIFMTEPDSPLFEMVGLTAPPEEEDFQSTGDGNRFSPADIVFLRVRSGITGEANQDSELGKRWSNETRSQAGIPWLRPPPLNRPLHQLTKDDFATDAIATPSGFDPLLLPTPNIAPDDNASLP